MMARGQNRQSTDLFPHDRGVKGKDVGERQKEKVR